MQQFGAMTFDDGFVRARDEAGGEIKFTRNESMLLHAFVQRAGQVLSRDQLLDAVSEPGSDKNDRNLDFSINRLRKKLKDSAQSPQFIATRYGEGYIWVAGAGEQVTNEQPSPSEPAANEDDWSDGRNAIAVLPLVNRTGSETLEYLADGIAEDVIMRLQRFRTFPVVSRGASFMYQHQRYDIRQIARELTVAYVATGTVRKSSLGLRLSFELIDAGTLTSIWAETFECGEDELFSIQDDVSVAVASMLQPEIERAELARPAPAALAEAKTWHLVRRGMWHQYRLTREDAAEARRYFEMALGSDPNSVEGLVQLAWWHWWDTVSRSKERDADWSEMEGCLRRARTLDAKDSRVACLSGMAEMMRGNLEACRRWFEEAVELNPSDAQAHSHLGSTFTLMGQPEAALVHLERGNRLSPSDFVSFHRFGELAHAHYLLGHWDEALKWAEASLRLRGGYWLAHVVKVGALARSGTLEQARAALDVLLSQKGANLDESIEWIMFADRQWTAYLKDGLALAGWIRPA